MKETDVDSIDSPSTAAITTRSKAVSVAFVKLEQEDTAGQCAEEDITTIVRQAY